MQEEWRKIDINPFYSISSLGRVRVDPHKVRSKNNSEKRVRGRILKTRIDRKNGYEYVNLGDRCRSKLVHRLVAQAFIPNPENKIQVNHIDGDKSNNAVSNLEWATREENMRHSCYVLGNMVKKVICTDTGDVYSSMRECARELGVTSGALWQVLSDKSYNKGRVSIKGKHFSYLGQKQMKK